MVQQRTEGTPKGKPGRADHVAVYGLYGNRLLALAVNAAGELVMGSEGGGSPVYDDITGAQIVISMPHHETHEGNTFQASYHTPNGAPIADDAVLELLVQTGVNYTHITGNMAAEGDFETGFYEDCTFSAAGTALVESNMNRSSATVAATAITHTPTITADGTLLFVGWMISGTKGKATGGVARVDTEWILKPNSSYLYRMTNRSEDTSIVAMTLQWYELGP